jgi:formylglycine-generating enzyme required for sulfatase activity
MRRTLWASVAVILSSGLATAADGGGTASPPPLFRDPATDMEMVFVKGGCFQMGDLYGDGKVVSNASDNVEEPVHEVCVGDFYIGKYEVTQGQWKKIMGSNPSRASAHVCVARNCPVADVSWSDVQDFIAKLNSRSGGDRYRLPTEAEWEYAARSGGKVQRYSGGNDIDAVSWFSENSGFRIDPERPVVHPVGTKAPNGLGIHDMSGNLWELTNDWYAANYYSTSPRDNPTGPASGEERVKRGGCASGLAANSRVSRRSTFSEPLPLEGFRLMRRP